ncbi:MAG: RNA polymerase sigma factor [Gammaproteobacteria bacterium]|nr:RNA polymerase sigma factor [Gammaproteobacteria bacterium]
MWAAARVLSSTLDKREEGTLDSTQALDRFLAGVERRAFRMAQLATGNVEDALDLVQEAMLKLAQHYGRRNEQEWGPLFHRILQSRIRDWYRRSRVRNRWRVWLGGEEGEEDPLHNLADTDAPGPAQLLAGQRAMGALEQALQKLPLRQQQAFLLRTWEGFDVAATAHAMGCSEGSVKTHYSRAVHTLRVLLEGHQP